MAKKNREIAVGLDIGTTKVVVLIGKRNMKGKIEIVGFGKTESLGVQNGMISDMAQSINSICIAVENASKSCGIIFNEVLAGIAGQYIESLQHSKSLKRHKPEKSIQEYELNQMINDVTALPMQPGNQILNILPQQYIVDGQSTMNPIGLCGSDLVVNYHLVLGKIAAIKNVGRSILDSKLKLIGLTLEPLASSAAILSDQERHNGVVLVDIGGGTTDIAVFKDGFIRHNAVIPMGGVLITKDIQEEFKILFHQAEALKKKVGSATPIAVRENRNVILPPFKGRKELKISIKHLAEVIEKRLRKIIQEIVYEIEHCGMENPQKALISGIVLTGGGSLLNHVVPFFEFHTHMETKIGQPSHLLAAQEKFNLDSPIYSTAIGLLNEALFHHDSKPKRKRSKKHYTVILEEKISQLIEQV
ncbi:MAG: cell division protein FtsA [Flavobacteriaceae bacterium]|nr:cell division protein FtsA [Flavobacteriaceae bacterium]MCY4268201.1 cell division protein FtsA [Flavobacteriaceae bacterium]MCY4300084.1 cell division protein FtsA [Flavobacteriaceae bacterium]